VLGGQSQECKLIPEQTRTPGAPQTAGLGLGLRKQRRIHEFSASARHGDMGSSEVASRLLPLARGVSIFRSVYCPLVKRA
jgi:hypothetical protein